MRRERWTRRRRRRRDADRRRPPTAEPRRRRPVRRRAAHARRRRAADGAASSSWSSRRDFVVKSRGRPRGAHAPRRVKRGQPAERARPAFDDRSTFARKLESELSAAERRLFPDSPSTASARARRIRGRARRHRSRLARHRHHPRHRRRHARRRVRPEAAAAQRPHQRPDAGDEPSAPPDPSAARRSPAATEARPTATLPDDEGDLADHRRGDGCSRTLHAAGFTGRVTLCARRRREDALLRRRHAGVRALDLRARSPGRPALARRQHHARAARAHARAGRSSRAPRGRAHAGRARALKSSELFPTVRRHVEEILYSLLRLGARPLSAGATSSRRPRTACGWRAHPWALFVEGVRRKYGLERLVELVGPPRDGADADDAAGARARRRRVHRRRAGARRAHRRRALARRARARRRRRAAAGDRRSTRSPGRCIAIGAVRVGEAGTQPGVGDVGVRAVPTLVTAPYGDRARRAAQAPRAPSAARSRGRPRHRPGARAAKRAQVQRRRLLRRPRRRPRRHRRTRSRAPTSGCARDFAPRAVRRPVRAELADALAEIGEVLDEALPRARRRRRARRPTARTSLD